MRRTSYCLTLAAVLALADCGGSRGVSISVTPDPSRADEPVHVVVSGLREHATTTIDLTATDADGIRWTSTAAFRADDRGRVDSDRSAPVRGVYSGAWGSGLVPAMRTKAPRASAFVWPKSFATFTVHVEGSGDATTTFRRRLSPDGLEFVRLGLAGTGVEGVFVAPTGARKRTAILAFGGSEGGLSTYFLAAALAARGYPTLAVAYFKSPGLPQTLSRIPLEYFAKTLRRLDARSEVDPERVVTLGISRGSEAALLLGVHYPQLVHGVVALVPSNSSICGLPGCDGPAWTFRGKAIPFTRQFDDAHPTDDPQAVIPVEQIRGPVFTACAGSDQIWTSCAYADAIAARRSARNSPWHDVSFEAEGASHLVGTAVPYEPAMWQGVIAQQTEQGREQLWPKLLSFLAANT